jgi:hypothetical protein
MNWVGGDALPLSAALTPVCYPHLLCTSRQVSGSFVHKKTDNTCWTFYGPPGVGPRGRGCAACQAHTPLQQFVRCLLDYKLLDHGDVVVMISTKATIMAKTTIT